MVTPPHHLRANSFDLLRLLQPPHATLCFSTSILWDSDWPPLQKIIAGAGEGMGMGIFGRLSMVNLLVSLLAVAAVLLRDFQRQDRDFGQHVCARGLCCSSFPLLSAARPMLLLLK